MRAVRPHRPYERCYGCIDSNQGARLCSPPFRFHGSSGSSSMTFVFAPVLVALTLVVLVTAGGADVGERMI